MAKLPVHQQEFGQTLLRGMNFFPISDLRLFPQFLLSGVGIWKVHQQNCCRIVPCCNLPCIILSFSTCFHKGFVLPRICSWNARGLFSADPCLRRRKLKVVQGLCHDHDIPVLVETHGERADVEQTFLGFSAFCCMHPTPSRGGVVVLVKDIIAMRVAAFVKLALGRLVYVRLLFDEDSNCGLSFYGIHVEGEKHDHSSRCAVRDALQEAICDHDLCIAIGDWNADPPHEQRSAAHNA